MASVPQTLVPIGTPGLAGRATCLTGAADAGLILAGDDRGETAVWGPDHRLLRHARMPSAVSSVAVAADGSRQAWLDSEGRLRVLDDRGQVCFDALVGTASWVRTTASGDCFHAIDPVRGRVEIFNAYGQAIQVFDVPGELAGYVLDVTDGAAVVVTRHGLVVRFTPWGRQMWARDFASPAAGISIDAAGALLAVALHRRGAECLLPDGGVSFGRLGERLNVRAVSLSDSGALLAGAGRELLQVDRRGHVLAETKLAEPAADVFLANGGTTAAFRGDDGVVRFLTRASGAAAPRDDDERREVELCEAKTVAQGPDELEVIVDKSAGPSARPRVRLRTHVGVPPRPATEPDEAPRSAQPAPGHVAEGSEPRVVHRTAIGPSVAAGRLWVAPDGSRAAVWSRGRLHVIDASGVEIARTDLEVAPLAVSLERDGRGLIVGTDEVRALPGTEHLLADRFILSAVQAALPPDGACLVVLDEYGGVRIQDRRTGDELTYELAQSPVPPRRLEAFGRNAVTALGAGLFRLIGPDTAHDAKVPPVEGALPQLATAIAGGAVLVRGAEVLLLGWDGAIVWTRKHSALVTDVVRGPAGQLLVAGHRGIALFDPSGAPHGKHARVQGHVVDLAGPAHAPFLLIVDGHRIVLSGATGRPIWQVTFDVAVRDARISPDGRVVHALLGSEIARVEAPPPAVERADAPRRGRAVDATI